MADVETAKMLKTPENVIELHTCISYMKDKSGINGWRDEQNLLKVNLTYCNFKPASAVSEEFFKLYY